MWLYNIICVLDSQENNTEHLDLEILGGTYRPRPTLFSCSNQTILQTDKSPVADGKTPSCYTGHFSLVETPPIQMAKLVMVDPIALLTLYVLVKPPMVDHDPSNLPGQGTFPFWLTAKHAPGGKPGKDGGHHNGWWPARFLIGQSIVSVVKKQ